MLREVFPMLREVSDVKINIPTGKPDHGDQGVENRDAIRALRHTTVLAQPISTPTSQPYNPAFERALLARPLRIGLRYLGD